jgi:hypothetical protein
MNTNEIITELPPAKVGTYIDQNINRVIEVVKEIYTITNCKNLFEIGTHVGHSSLVFLLENFNVFSTDIDDQWTTKDNLDKIQSVFNKYFPNKYTQIIQNSQNHDFFLDYFSNKNLDIIHIDGLHTYDYCKNDIILGKRLGIKYFIIDDYQHAEMRMAASSESLKLIKEWVDIHSYGVSIGLLINEP